MVTSVPRIIVIQLNYLAPNFTSWSRNVQSFVQEFPFGFSVNKSVCLEMVTCGIFQVSFFQIHLNIIIDFHIPNTANMGSPQKPIECSCPSEENIMSTMAIYDHYRKLTSDASCAREEHGQVYPVDTFKTKLVSEIEDWYICLNHRHPCINHTKL